eukprot:gene2637-5175_t
MSRRVVIPSGVSPEQLLEHLTSHRDALLEVQHASPELYNAVIARDIPAIRMIIMRNILSGQVQQYERQQEIIKMEADPMNPEYQRKIAEEIRMKNVEENRDLAMEQMPEAFGSVIMLYINVELNGKPLQAFVDSGAQMTIMSVACAERCNLMRLVDPAWSGVARGVGTAKIVGRIHIAQMKLGNSFFPISITVLEKNDLDFIFGLDMLKRFRCIIDLSANSLRVEGNNGFEEALFISEGDLIRKGFLNDLTEEEENALLDGKPSPPTPVEISAAFSDKVAHLVGLGFSDVDAASALSQVGEDLEMAAALLFNQT